MRLNKKRKGFTLTELAIVIAVIAILVAVLVPTFITLINKAHESSDSQLAKNMNTLLELAETDGDTPERMEDVNEILVDGGYTIAKLTPTAEGNIFVWNEDTNRISYIDEDGTVIFAGDTTLTADEKFTAGGNYWVTVESASEITTWTGLSYYLGANITLSEPLTISSASSIDTGTYTLTGDVKYEGTVSSSSVKYNTVSKKVAATSTSSNDTAVIWGEVEGTVTFATSNLKVINHSTATVDLKSTAVSEYTEYGYVKSLDISSNKTTKITISNTGVIDELVVGSDTSYTNVTNNGYIEEIVATSGTSVEKTSVTLATASAGYVGNASVKNTDYAYEISNYSELASFRDKVNNGKTFSGITVKLTANIDISSRTWVPIGYDSRDNAKNYHSGSSGVVYYYFGGEFDGNGYTISGLTNNGFTPTTTREDTYGKGSNNAYTGTNYLYGLFGIINDANIHDLTLTNVNIINDNIAGDSVGAIAGFASGGCTIKNCSVYGSIEATDAAAGIIGRIYIYDCSGYTKTIKSNNTVNIENCDNYATIKITATNNNTSKAAGIAGYINDEKETCSVTITNCNNYGDVSANIYTAGIVTISSHVTIKIKDCSNSGNITSTNDTNYSGTSNVGSIVCDTRYTYTNSNGVKSVLNYSSNITVLSCSNSGEITSNGNGYLFNYNDENSYVVTKTGGNASLDIGTGSTIIETEETGETEE